jgi:hypothetical protein
LEANAARIILSELEVTADQIAMVRMTRPNPHYSNDFSLPTVQWQTHGPTLATTSPRLFEAVGSAYKSIEWVNRAFGMRRTRQGSNQMTLAVIADDHLDQAEMSTARAITALKKATKP